MSSFSSLSAPVIGFTTFTDNNVNLLVSRVREVLGDAPFYSWHWNDKYVVEKRVTVLDSGHFMVAASPASMQKLFDQRVLSEYKIKDTSLPNSDETYSIYVKIPPALVEKNRWHPRMIRAHLQQIIDQLTTNGVISSDVVLRVSSPFVFNNGVPTRKLRGGLFVNPCVRDGDKVRAKADDKITDEDRNALIVLYNVIFAFRWDQNYSFYRRWARAFKRDADD